MTAADKLRELLASRPAHPNLEELVRWWRTSAELLPALLEQPKVLTTGRLDGLVITPIRDGDEIRFLEFTVDTLPGLRLVLEAGAARELCEALGVILRNATPQGDLDGLRTELDAARVALSKQGAVTPAFILEQRAKGWPAVHPEDYCHRCGAANMSWYTDRQTWLEATSAWAAETGREGICCPRCFAEMHKEQTGKSIAWLVAGPEFERAIQYAENMAGAAIAPQGYTPTERIRLAAQCALRARNIERAAVDVLKQEVREIEQQCDALSERLDVATNLDTRDAEIIALRRALRAALATWCPRDPGGDGADGDTYRLVISALGDDLERHAGVSSAELTATLHVGDTAAPVTVVGRTAAGMVTLQVTDPATIAALKNGTGPVSLGYVLGEPAAPAKLTHPDSWLDCAACCARSKSGAEPPRCEAFLALEAARAECERMEAGHA